jgi:hypothetical protein
VADLNANLQQFINALAGLPVRPWVAARHLVPGRPPEHVEDAVGKPRPDDRSSILGLDRFSTFDHVAKICPEELRPDGEEPVEPLVEAALEQRQQQEGKYQANAELDVDEVIAARPEPLPTLGPPDDDVGVSGKAGKPDVVPAGRLGESRAGHGVGLVASAGLGPRKHDCGAGGGEDDHRAVSLTD